MTTLLPLEHFLHRPGNHLDALEAPDREWLTRRLRFRWHPRRLEAAAAFVAERTAGKPFYLYGAGTHTHGLLDRLDGETLQNLRGIVDRNTRPGQMLKGHPVHPPQRLREDPHVAVVLSHHEFEDNMGEYLEGLGIAGSRVIPIYADAAYGEAVSEPLWGALQEEIASIPPPAGKRVLFINSRQRRILAPALISRLRAQGVHQFIQIKLDRWSGDEQEEAAFDAVLNTHNGLALALNTIEQLAPDLIYVQEHFSSGNFLPLLVGLAFPERRVIGEFYDFLALTFDDPYVMHWGYYWRQRDVSLALASERWSIAHLAGLVTKESGPVLGEYLADCPHLELQPHLGSGAFRDKRAGLHAPPRLVWGGAIATSRLSPVMFGDNQLIDVFTRFDAAGLPVTAYSSCADEAQLQSDYPEYLELAKGGRFAMLPAIPLERLLGVLAAEFDFGLMLGIPKPDTQQGISHRVTVSGKMFTYLAAGLPVIVGAYLEVMAAWVREHGLGLVVDHREIDRLPELIARCDYPRLLENVRRYRARHNLESLLPALTDFLEGGGRGRI